MRASSLNKVGDYLFIPLSLMPTFRAKGNVSDVEFVRVKFLIVDDNRSIRETLIRIVKKESDEVIECEDGGDAVELYKLHRPDWVFMDIQMKYVGGIEATSQILAIDSRAKIVMVTDYGDKFFRRAAENAGAIGFLAKENLSEIISIVGRES